MIADAMPREGPGTTALRLPRRAILTAAGATLVAACSRGLTRTAPTGAALGPNRDEAPPGAIGAALDDAARLPPAEGIARLAAFDPGRLGAGPRLDLVTARAGLAIDARLAALPDTRGPKGGYRPPAGSGPIDPDHYALLLARPLGPVTPRAARVRLTRALADLHARAAALFATIGLTTGSIGERYIQLWQDERYLYREPAAAVADMTRALAAARVRVAATVGPVPAWCTDVAVRTLSVDEIAAGRNGYRVAPSPTRQGEYIVDLRDLRRRPSWTVPSVVAHELLPGHMIQLGLEGATPPHPLRIDYAASFVEGWGIYAEALAAGDGAFADPYAMLGHLHWLIFRAARALVDLGMHLEGWSADAARARLVAWQGEPAYFAPYDTELSRIANEPASRVAEAMAWLTIADRARGRQGAARIRFHQGLLVHGRMRSDTVGNTS